MRSVGSFRDKSVEIYLSLCIGLLTAILRLIVLASPNRKYDFSWSRTTIMGLSAAFNKGLRRGATAPLSLLAR